MSAAKVAAGAARDKAVEEAAYALRPFPSEEDMRTLLLLWSRAQEAEREENCKAMCVRCFKRWKHDVSICDAGLIRARTPESVGGEVRS